MLRQGQKSVKKQNMNSKGGKRKVMKRLPIEKNKSLKTIRNVAFVKKDLPAPNLS